MARFVSTHYQCRYCDRIWDSSKYGTCPSCGAPPEIMSQAVQDKVDADVAAILDLEECLTPSGKMIKLPTPPPLRLEY